MNTKIKTYSTGDANQKFAQMMRDVQDEGIILITSNNKPKAIVTAYEEASKGNRNKLFNDMKKGLLIKAKDEEMIVKLAGDNIIIARKYKDLFDEESYDESVYAQIDVSVICGDKNIFILANGMPKQALSFSVDVLELAGGFGEVSEYGNTTEKMASVRDAFKDTDSLVEYKNTRCVCYLAE